MITLHYSVLDDPDLLAKEQIDDIAINHWSSNNITSTFIKSYFRQIEDQYIKLKFVNNSGLSKDDPYIRKIMESILLKESSKNESGVNRKVSESGKIDENINMYELLEYSIFNNELVFYQFNNEWQHIQLNNSTEVRDSMILNFGGGTNAINSIIDKNKTNSLEEYNKIVQDKYKFYNNEAHKTVLIDCTNRGVFQHANAEAVTIILSQGIDFLNNSEFTAAVFLYSEKNNATYSVVDFMNFSRKNFNFDIRNDLYRQLAYLVTLTYINE